MRLPEQMEKVGYFWLPEDTKQQLPGTLRISDSGEIALEVIGSFGDPIDQLNDQPSLGRIVGIIENGDLVTLDSCRYTQRNISFGGVSKSLIHASLALLGAHYDKDEPITFSRVKFSVEGLDQWLSISGIRVTRNWETKSATIKYDPPQELLFSLPDNISLAFTFSWTLPSERNPTEAKVTQKAYVSLESKDLRPFDFFSSIIFKLTNLFCFAIDDTVTLDSVTGFSYELKKEMSGGDTYEVPIKLYYQSLPFSEVKPKLDWDRMLFRYGHIKNDFERIITNWLTNYDVSNPAFNLYFASKSGGYRYLEGRFLSLAQGVETLHRRNSSETLMPVDRYNEIATQLVAACPAESKGWLENRLKYGNELSLRARLKQILAPFHRFFGNAGQRKCLVSKIIDTRNYLTHYDPRLVSSAAEGEELWKICRKLECLFQLHFLRLVGLSDQDIDKLEIGRAHV